MLHRTRLDHNKPHPRSDRWIGERRLFSGTSADLVRQAAQPGPLLPSALAPRWRCGWSGHASNRLRHRKPFRCSRTRAGLLRPIGSALSRPRRSRVTPCDHHSARLAGGDRVDCLAGRSGGCPLRRSCTRPAHRGADRNSASLPADRTSGTNAGSRWAGARVRIRRPASRGCPGGVAVAPPGPRSSRLLQWSAGVVREVLPNGLTLLVQPERSAPVVAVVTHVKAGFFDEPDSWVGISHVLEHMFFKGTARRGVGAIARETKAAGGYLNASTSYDHTTYFTVLPAGGLEAALDIQSDALRNSAIDADELARELRVIIQEAKRKLDSPAAVAYETLHEIMFDRHRIRRWRIGREAEIAGFTRDDVLGYYRS